MIQKSPGRCKLALKAQQEASLPSEIVISSANNARACDYAWRCCSRMQGLDAGYTLIASTSDYVGEAW